jgi:glycosyltransferase involved in cell wall biosynthesis
VVAPIDQPRKLLFVCNVAWFFVSHRLALAKAAQAAGYEVHVASDIETPGEERTLELAGVRFHRVPMHRGGLSPYADLKTLLQLAALIRKYRPDVVHNVTIKPVLYGSLAARMNGVRKVVNAVSGLGYLFVDASRARGLRALAHHMYRVALQAASVRVIFQNEDDRSFFVRSGLVAPEKTRLIAGSGVDLNAFAAVDPPQSETIRIVLPARMLVDKGVLEFAEAAAILRQRQLPVECLLAGGLDPANPAALSLQDLERLQGDGSVRWLGHVKDMVELLRNAHIVCLPSYREGLPKALIEACAAARAIVTTDVPGCRDVVENGVNGFVVPARNGRALAEALAQLALDPELCKRMGQAGRERAGRLFDIKSVIAQTLSLYGDDAGRR